VTTRPSPIDSDIVRFGGGFILVCLTLVALVGIAMAIKDVQHHYDVADWPTTTATVTRSVLDDVRGTESTEGARHFRPLFGFTYEVEGKTFKTDTRRIFGPMRRGDAAAIVAEYAPGTTFPVYYDPEDPDDVALDNDPPLLSGQSVGFLVPTLAYGIYFGGWLVPAFFRKRRARRTAA
jgi:hypothetical protein